MSAIPEAMQRERYADECRAAGVLALYEALLAKGNWPGAAAMYALQSAPGTKGSDRTFCEGARRSMESMPEQQLKAIVEIARKAGVKTDGKFYKGGLGRYDDPAAWVATADDVLASAKAKNLTVRGAVNHQGRLPEGPVKKVPLAPDLIERATRDMLHKDQSLAQRVKKNPKKLREVKERVVALYGKQR